jgi:hypothetical protein
MCSLILVQYKCPSSVLSKGWHQLLSSIQWLPTKILLCVHSVHLPQAALGAFPAAQASPTINSPPHLLLIQLLMVDAWTTMGLPGLCTIPAGP